MTTSQSRYLNRYGRHILGAEIVALWRLCAVSADGPIRLLDTLVLECDGRFVSLSYSQEGLDCMVAAGRDEVRWAPEPELPMTPESGADEWLDLVELEDDAIAPKLPLRAHTMEGWFAEGPYRDVFALVFGIGAHQLVLMTTDEGDLMCTTREIALRRAERVAKNMGLRTVHERLTQPVESEL